ncbi:MAG TPA: uroporphyrinogen decarboxylase family protein [Armatimonadota bacterium]|nr:uroporphyrinogen decarboxylase family protein [Armatimonadota bacterium]
MNHIERVKAAYRFEGPDCLPLEIHDVVHLYDAYDTLDPATVKLVPGVASFDSLRVTYHWTFTEEGVNAEGERIRRDEWGCLQRVPESDQTAYDVIEKPLSKPGAIGGYAFPDPSISDPFFERTKATIAEHYPDRFICGYVDPGPLLIAFNLYGYDGLLMRLHDNLDEVVAVVRQIAEYQKAIIDRWASIGVHMVAIIDEFAGTDGLMFSPALWREHFADIYANMFGHIRSHGLLAGCLFDGDISAILDDYLAIGPDVIEIVQPNTVGIETWAEKLRGKVACKASVDMMGTLATGTPADCRREARKLVEALATPEGGFAGISLRWHRPEYPKPNVSAVAEAFNEFRGPALG